MVFFFLVLKLVTITNYGYACQFYSIIEILNASALASKLNAKFPFNARKEKNSIIHEFPSTSIS